MISFSIKTVYFVIKERLGKAAITAVTMMTDSRRSRNLLSIEPTGRLLTD